MNGDEGDVTEQGTMDSGLDCVIGHQCPSVSEISLVYLFFLLLLHLAQHYLLPTSNLFYNLFPFNFNIIIVNVLKFKT